MEREEREGERGRKRRKFFYWSFPFLGTSRGTHWMGHSLSLSPYSIDWRCCRFSRIPSAAPSLPLLVPCDLFMLCELYSSSLSLPHCFSHQRFGVQSLRWHSRSLFGEYDESRLVVSPSILIETLCRVIIAESMHRSLSGNFLSGSIPSSIANLRSLKYL
jgi:hypothetical protein